MIRAIFLGAYYFAGMFALGFVLGTVRVMVLAPTYGDWAATFIELPVMLAISWLYCGWLLRHRPLPASVAAHVLMGLVAFILLMIAETALGVGLFERSIFEQLDVMTSGVGLVGLLGQIAFASFPLMHARRHGTRTPRSFSDASSRSNP